MGGFKKMITDLIPLSWYEILRKHKCVQRYVDIVYFSYCNSKQNRKRDKEELSFCSKRIKEAMRETSETSETRCFWLSADFFKYSKSQKEFEMWQLIKKEINISKNANS